MCSTSQIILRIESILEYLQPHWEWLNCHMVSYLTDKHWVRYVPLQMRQNIETVDQIEKCIQQVFWNNSGSIDFPDIHHHLVQSRQYCLQNFPELLTSSQKLKDILNIKATQDRLSIKEFMSEKKRHEVEITAELVNDLIDSHNGQELFIVDAGDGKGYLSSRLALQYGHKILGIDCKESNTENALERSKKLEKAWNGLTERALLQNQGITPPRRGKKTKSPSNAQPKKAELVKNYKTIAKFITPKLNIAALLKNIFEIESKEDINYCLTGLHTCGNLASTCLQVFQAQPNCKLLCNIGCCYHLLNEAYSGPEFYGNKAVFSETNSIQDIGFPLSSFLNQKQLKLGRNARMLAAQSLERTIASKELPHISLYFRSLLEILICQTNPELKNFAQVGKIKKFSNFEEYLQLCQKKLQLNEDILNAQVISKVLEEYKNEQEYLNLFYLLRMSFAPVLESLILLDRLLYLKENGYEKSYLISVFDAVISPRHYGIVAIK